MAELRFGTVTETSPDGKKAKIDCGAGLPRTAFLPVAESARPVSAGDFVALIVDANGGGDGVILGRV